MQGTLDTMEIIRETYTLHEKCLDVDKILGMLYERRVINKQTKQDIEGEKRCMRKTHILLSLLERVNEQTLLVYCDILEESNDLHNDYCHKKIAERVRFIIDCHREKDDFQKLDALFNQEWHTVSCRHPRFEMTDRTLHSISRVTRSSTLNSDQFTKKFNQLWDLQSKDVAKSIEIVKGIQSCKINPDLKAGLMQAGAGFESASIPLLLKALVISKNSKDECFLNCRLNWQLMWCYDRQGDKVERDHHLDLALAEASRIGPDFSAAFVMAWKAFMIMCECTPEDDISQLEISVSNLLETAYESIQRCLEMRWFVEAVALYKSDWHLRMFKLYSHRKDTRKTELHRQGMLHCLEKFERPFSDPIQYAEKVEVMFDNACEAFHCGKLCKRSEFGRYACCLYLKFGQFVRARSVIRLVGSDALLHCIDRVEACLRH